MSLSGSGWVLIAKDVGVPQEYHALGGFKNPFFFFFPMLSEVQTDVLLKSTRRWLHPSIEPREWVLSDDCLSDCTTESNHGQAPILQLSNAHLLLALLVLRKPAGKAIVSSSLH